MLAPPSLLYDFGDFRLDSIRRVLRRADGETVPLTPRVFDTLLFLVENPDTVLDKERIMEAVWSDSIVEENNLTQNISTLRRMLGETPGSHRFIVTVPGRGYRFVADVKSVNGTEEADAASPRVPEPQAIEPTTTAPEPAQYRSTVGALPIVGFGFLVLAVAGFLLFRGAAQRKGSPPVAASAQPIARKSVAVLPFENLSTDPENAFFAVGIQDEILSNLAKISDLKVISRTSANVYKTGSPRNAREIGQQLGVVNLLEGSVQRAGDRVHVNAQLIDATTDAHLWAQTYDRNLANVFAIQAEIAQAIAERLQAQISPPEGKATKPTPNPDAYLLYLRGRETENGEGSPASYADAIDYYQRAIDLDPSFAVARSRLSICASNVFRQPASPLIAGHDSTIDLRAKERARAEAEEALRLQPRLGEAHLAMALCYLWADGDDESALAELRTAEELLPNSAEVPLIKAFIHKIHVRFPERLAALERAETLDPRNRPVLFLTHLTHRWMRNWAASIRLLERGSILVANDEQPIIAAEKAFDEFHLTSDLASLDRIFGKNSGVSENQTPTYKFGRYALAMLRRDYPRAVESLALISQDDLDAVDYGDSKSFHEAILAVARSEDQAATQAALATARADCDARMARINARGGAGAPDVFAIRFNNAATTATLRANIGILEAFRGRKAEAITAANDAVVRYPEPEGTEKNQMKAALALVYARVGETDKALDLIEHLLTVPAELPVGAIYNITLADLKLSWVWDPLRSNPRFQKLLANSEPTIQR